MDLKERGRRSGAAVQQGNGYKRAQWSRTRVTVDKKYLKNPPNKMKQERSEYDQVIRCLRRSTFNPERDVDDYRRRIARANPVLESTPTPVPNLLYGKRRRPLTSPTTRTAARISCTAIQMMAGFALNMDYPIAANW